MNGVQTAGFPQVEKTKTKFSPNTYKPRKSSAGKFKDPTVKSCKLLGNDLERYLPDFEPGKNLTQKALAVK